MPRRYRKKRASSSEEDERGSPTDGRDDDVGLVSVYSSYRLKHIMETCSKKLEEAKELQKFRKRPGGVR